jgi:hypothetical protein
VSEGNKVFFFWRKAKSRCFGLGLLFQKYNFLFFFRKDALRLGSNIIETFWFAPRKISRWKNLFVFQRLMFLYQLVNLVLETCFIFSKTLKLSKTFLSWVCRLVRPLDQRALWLPYSRLFFGTKCSRKCGFLNFFGVFYKVNCSVDLGFLTHLFSERCLNCWLVKEIITLSFGRHVENVFYLKDFVTWCLYQGRMKFFYCYCLFFLC